MDRAAALRDFEQAEQALRAGSNSRTICFVRRDRVSLGKHLLQPAIVERLMQEGYTCVLWNSVPGDYRDPDGWLERAVSDCQSRDWTLLVLHDLPNGAMTHLDEFIDRLKREGFEFTQEFPPACVPILDGKAVLPLDPYMNG